MNRSPGILCISLLAETVTNEAIARGQGLGVAVVQLLMTKLELGLGHYEDARIGALNVFDQDPLYVGSMAQTTTDIPSSFPSAQSTASPLPTRFSYTFSRSR